MTIGANVLASWVLHCLASLAPLIPIRPTASRMKSLTLGHKRARGHRPACSHTWPIFTGH